MRYYNTLEEAEESASNQAYKHEDTTFNVLQVKSFTQSRQRSESGTGVLEKYKNLEAEMEVTTKSYIKCSRCQELNEYEQESPVQIRKVLCTYPNQGGLGLRY